MQDLLTQYLPILVFLGVAAGLGLVLMLSAILVAVRNPDPGERSRPTNAGSTRSTMPG